jgi:uncharacterized protein (TIGR03067 family)
LLVAFVRWKMKDKPMRKNILYFISIVALLWASGCSTLHKSDLTMLQGTWKGQEIGGNTEGSRYLIISGNTIEFQGANNDDWCRGTFTVREDTNPRQIVGTVTQCHSPRYIGKTARAIYRVEGDTLTVTGYDPGNPEVSSGFDAPGARHFVLKRD